MPAAEGPAGGGKEGEKAMRKIQAWLVAAAITVSAGCGSTPTGYEGAEGVTTIEEHGVWGRIE